MGEMPRDLSAHRALDPQSSHALRRFCILVLFMLVWSLAARSQEPLHTLTLMMSAATILECLLAVLHRERFNAAALNHWDGAFGFLGIACFARALA
jgi:membrane glycosyltransferase